jgi:hypothetical protein
MVYRIYVYERYERFCLIDTGSVAVVIQGKVIGCNGAGIGLCVLKICQPVCIIIAVAGMCAVEVASLVIK